MTTTLEICIMWDDVPWLGIGQRFDSSADASRFPYLGRGIDFIEPSLPIALDVIPQHVPLVAHSSELPLASRGQLNPRMVDAIAKQVRKMAPPYAGEHFCLTSTIETGEIGYNFSPTLDSETIAASVEHVKTLEGAYGCPIAIEAGPRYHAWGDEWDDHKAMATVAEQSGAGIIVDVSHHLCTALNLKRDPQEGLSARVCERTVELHVTGIGTHRTDGFYYDSHRNVVPDGVWQLLQWLVPRCPSLKAVTLEHASSLPDDKYREDLLRLNTMVAQARSTSTASRRGATQR